MSIYNYNKQITAYHDGRVNLPENIRVKLREHRSANQDRIINNIGEGILVSKSSFIKQGSYAMRTTIQHPENDYDIDDGLMLNKEELVGNRGAEMTPLQVRDMVFESVKDEKFKRQPKRLKNCVRVYYNEGHHVDIPCYRTYDDDNGGVVTELASSDWKKSNPKEINDWFLKKRKESEENRESRGLQLRRMIRLIKRFTKSRPSWNMPSGLILTMLVVEKFPDFERDDECFYGLLKALKSRLAWDLEVTNAADSSWFNKENLTKTEQDTNMVELRDRINEVLKNLIILESPDCTKSDARRAWDWVFKTDGFFDDFDGDDEDDRQPGGSGIGTGIAIVTPKKPVDHRGGGRFG